MEDLTIFEEGIPMQKSKVNSAVGMTRLWGAREAGRDVAQSVMEKLGCEPDFLILFSTIHYEKYGGLQEFLNGVWDVFSNDIPLIGGTVSGFMNNEGCYTRGATALGVSYPNMDVAVGVGHKTKQYPARAARNCANMILNSMEKSVYKNGIIIDVISGGLTFQIPFLGRRRVFRDMPGFLTNATTRLTSYLLSKGPGREEEVLEDLTKSLKDYYVLSGSAMDDNMFLSNYQFFNKEVLQNSVVAIAIRTDLEFDIRRDHGLSSTDRKFKVTKLSSDKRFIYKINGKPAVNELLKMMSWPDSYMTEELLHSRTLYYPIGFEHNDEIAIDVIALVSGNSLCMVHQIKNENLYVLSAGGRELVNAVDICLDPFLAHNPAFGVIFSCGIRLDTLGSKVYKVHEKLSQYFKDKPFLLTYVTGEGTRKPNERLRYGNDTFNLSVFWDE